MAVFINNSGLVWKGAGGAAWTSITGIQPLVITTPNIIPVVGIINIPYAYTMQASGGIPPYTWAMVSDVGSNNIWTVTSFGSLTGTPTVSETDVIIISVTDSVLNQTTGSFSVTVTPASDTFTIGFTPPAYTGGSPVDNYRATAWIGGIAIATGFNTVSPITVIVPGTYSGQVVSFTIAAHNASGWGPESIQTGTFIVP